ncbi:MAG: hypothetical protein ACT4PT_09560 [Methanobacteriota archaeon]
MHQRSGTVLWCDGDHGFNPYSFAEINLVRGLAADHGAERVLVKRCMTPFQWDTVLTRHLPEKLATTPSPLVLALPYDRLFSTDELQPWEQRDYVEYSIESLRDLAARHSVPILLGAHLARWSLTHPELAARTVSGVERRYRMTRSRDGSFTVAPDAGARVVPLGGQTRLVQFA